MSARGLLAGLVLATAGCGGFGEYGANGLLGFATERECYDAGCDQLRGIAVGASQGVRVTDPDCSPSEGEITVTATGAIRVRSVGPTEHDSGSCSTFVLVEAMSEGRGTLQATSPSGASDSYGLFGAVATTMTLPEGDRGWAGRAETEDVTLAVGDLWSGDVRLTDAERRPLMHDSSGPVWSSDSPATLGLFAATEDVFQALAPGETTVTASYLGLSATVSITVTP